MSPRPYDLEQTPDGPLLKVRARGSQLLATPMLNRGTAFTLAEREDLGLIGLLPPGVMTMEGQLRRIYPQYLRQPSNLAKWVYLSNLRDRNEVLFYRLLSEHIEEMLPVVYTPTVGQAIERYSHEFRRPHGVYLSVEHPEDVETSLENFAQNTGDIDLIVATDSEGILGIGDWGIGGIEIAIGKLSLYTAAAGIHPRRVIPVVLDMGTDNLGLLNDEMYLGYRHARVRGERYDEFIEAYVAAAIKLFPHAMLHWEDFGASNARRIVTRYADRLCTFNDDMQGTAAVVLAAALAATRASGTRMRDQIVVIHGAGTAGIGIADMIRDVMIAEGLSADEAMGRFYALGSRGLVTTALGDRLRDFQVPYARSSDEIAGWAGPDGRIGLASVVANAHPTMLVGTSAQPRAFSEGIVRQMAADVGRPIIMPLSNPTDLCEALPEDLLRWTDGRALVATGSPFPPVERDGRQIRIAQANNALVFPGLGLGVAVSRASRITPAMLSAAARAVADVSDATEPGAALLPPVQDLRKVSAAVAIAVVEAAVREGVAGTEIASPIQQVYEYMWRPVYPPVVAI